MNCEWSDQRTAGRRLLAVAMGVLLICTTAPRAASAAQAQESVMLVLDASGSMWGKIEDRHKIEVAREAVSRLLDGWSSQRHIGLLAYGHRRKGDCADIETLAPVGPLDAAAFKAQVNALNPKGKTPITAAVRAAAEDLRFREERATVILVSDGLETCNADPCALGKELEAAGVDFTAHVIGFDLAGQDTASLACLARETGGEFIAAANADQLQAAVQVVAAPAPAEPVAPAVKTQPPATYTFEATEGKNGAVIRSDLSWQLTGVGDPPSLEQAFEEARPSALLPRGEYSVQVSRAIDGAQADKRFRVTGSVKRRMTLVLPPYTPAATLLAPPTVQAGSKLDVEWTGPGQDGDYITLVEAGAKEGTSGSYSYSNAGSPAELTAPDEPGTHELRYVLGETRRTIAMRPIEVEAVSATITAAGSVAAGAPFEVEWTGPNNEGDYLTLVPADEKEGRSGPYAYTSAGSPAELRAPDAAGSYELRYSTGQSRRTLARLALMVGEVGATVAAPERVPAGSEFEVEWTGPNNEGDYVTLVPADAKEGKSGPYAYTSAGSPLQLRAPDAAGSYELRYSMGQSRKTLARKALTIGEVTATLTALDSVPAGSEFEVQWTGPGNDGDYLTVVPTDAKEGKSGSYAYTKAGSPVQLKAPDQPGSYELRYSMGQARKTLARRALTVSAVSATLDAPQDVSAGSEFEVEWTGPDNEGDFVTVVPVDAKQRKYGDYARTRKGSPVELTAPDEPGAYELRYLMGASRETLVRRAITVLAVEATLRAADSVAAGSEIEVEWDGPNNKNDLITIVPVSAKERKYADYARTRKGSPLELTAPDVAGEYELRYLVGKSRDTLTRVPISVTAVEATLQAEGEVLANETLEVEWTGPNNKKDYITIVPAGSKEGKTGNYTRTRKGSPLEVRAPKAVGDYELRYVMGQSRKTLSSQPLRVVAP